MKASIRPAVIGVVGGIVLSSAAAGANAAPGHFVIPASRSMELHAKGSHGFGINIFGNASQVYLTARGHHATNIYMVRGRAGEKEIKARFGRIGRVSMRFRAGRKARVVPASDGNCKGGGEVIERGSFIGTLNFRGEQGYTTVRTVHAAGRVVRIGRLACEGGAEEGSSSGPHWLSFSAISKDGKVSFGASKITSKALPELDGAFFNASIFETHVRGMSVIRALDAQVDASSFKVGQSHGHIATASASPPAPFHGTAAYQRKGGAPSWIGTLTGDFPGRGEVRLAGPKFCAGFPSPPPTCASGAFQVTFFG